MFQRLVQNVIDIEIDVFRNIPGIVVSEDLFDDLSINPQDRTFCEALVSELKEMDDFSTVIMRPFAYGIAFTDAHQGILSTRFSDGTRFGVWYGSLDLLTSVYETVYHFRKRISDMLAPIDEEIISERRTFLVHVSGILIDIRDKYREFPKLIDPADYSFTQAFGAYLHNKGQSGLLVKSARYHNSVNVAAFKPDILSNPRHHSYMIYRWIPGDFEVRIEKTRGRTWKILRM